VSFKHQMDWTMEDSRICFIASNDSLGE